MISAEDILIRLATPEACGSGFYLAKHDVIVTAEHIIRGNRHVIVESDKVKRQLADVVYTDPMMDLALLKVSKPLDITEIENSPESTEENEVISLSSPFGMSRQKKVGHIKASAYEFHGIPHVLHDAILGNDCSGGPLLSSNDQLIGMNQFIKRKSEYLGLTLPISTIVSSITEYEHLSTKYATRCGQCGKHVYGVNIDNCRHCGAFITMPYVEDPKEVTGIRKTIEELIVSMGYTLSLSRIGPDHWEIIHGSAAINITYYEKNGLIIGDAYLCKLPPGSNKKLYEFLLRQNQEMENLTFSIKDDDIILSLLIYDRYLDKQTGTELLSNLLEKADYYDNILVNQYKCLWVSSRKL